LCFQTNGYVGNSRQDYLVLPVSYVIFTLKAHRGRPTLKLMSKVNITYFRLAVKPRHNSGTSDAPTAQLHDHHVTGIAMTRDP